MTPLRHRWRGVHIKVWKGKLKGHDSLLKCAFDIEPRIGDGSEQAPVGGQRFAAEYSDSLVAAPTRKLFEERRTEPVSLLVVRNGDRDVGNGGVLRPNGIRHSDNSAPQLSNQG